MMFFFSSRRRHTRYWRDWSSDVCSSDLSARDRQDVDRRPPAGGQRRGGWRVRRPSDCPQRAVAALVGLGEGRVGEEWRFLWAPLHLKKKNPYTRLSSQQHNTSHCFTHIY